MNTRRDSLCYTNRLLDDSKVWCTCWDKTCIYEAPGADFTFEDTTFEVAPLEHDEFGKREYTQWVYQNKDWKYRSAPIRLGTGVLWKVFFFAVMNIDNLTRAMNMLLSFSDSFPIKRSKVLFRGPLWVKGLTAAAALKSITRSLKLHVLSNRTSFKDLEGIAKIMSRCFYIVTKGCCLISRLYCTYFLKMWRKKWPKQPFSLCLALTSAFYTVMATVRKSSTTFCLHACTLHVQWIK